METNISTGNDKTNFSYCFIIDSLNSRNMNKINYESLELDLPVANSFAKIQVFSLVFKTVVRNLTKLTA